MENEEVKKETIELTPELKAKLEQIQLNSDVNANKNKKKTGPIIAVVAVLLLLACTACAFFFLNNKKDDKKEETPTALAINDAVKSTIYEKIAVLNYADYKSTENTNVLSDGLLKTRAFMLTYLVNFYENEGYTSKQKLHVLLTSLNFDENRFERIDTQKYTESDFAGYLKDNKMIPSWNAFVDYVKAVPVDYVANRYKEIYGEDIENSDVTEMCGGYNYDGKNGLYLSGLNDGCGGVDFRSGLLKVYNFESDANNYYIDMNVATVYAGDDFKTDNTTCKVYSGIIDVKENTEVYKNCSMDETYRTDFKLTDEDTVAKYRYTFDKDYHFKGIKKL